ncbi:PAS domain S-box-containing protein/diguanylate cyclase (GGDEF) domain-containing protein [Noviherbaspirillum humi]|uniref:PAS domain S-box-containing protein/diguanylate cyclase (GGDEF) domain-containing protein n=1 Tax=Noviherbaspirillum humi TaxID=1688639 RepID=A0A239J265_9BURK|nr:EAL domain-containing protein [Noviherbaspirillum humi]SNS99865.1 PAS domain S-box-containing protein/diguanylate cyclase (GGDEF) domain-containing protein [Noviherbaspirillum humi]
MQVNNYPVHQDRVRLAALGSYAILDTPPEQQFDRLVRLAAKACEMPMAALSFVDEHRQWFKATFGLAVRETDIAASFCKYAICDKSTFVVEDASTHPLFIDNPLVTGDLHLRFYAGCPLVSPEGHALGALIVLDKESRTLSSEQRLDLEVLAEQTMMALELRRQRLNLDHLLAHRKQAHLDLDNLTSASPAANWEMSPDRAVFQWTSEATAMLGMPAAALSNIDDIGKFIHPAQQEAWKSAFHASAARGTPVDVECLLLCSDGGWRNIRWVAVAEWSPPGVVSRVFGAIQEVPLPEDMESVSPGVSDSGIRRAPAAPAARRVVPPFKKLPTSVVVTDLDGRVVYWNEGAERLYGWSVEEAQGRVAFADLVEPPDSFEAIRRDLLNAGELNRRIHQKGKNGGDLTVDCHLTLIRDHNRLPQLIFIIGSDQIEPSIADDKIYALAFYDQLTQLPNRASLMDRLRHALLVAERKHAYGALMLLDLDNFKSLNDTLGHAKGDLLLQQVAARLLKCVRQTDTVARLGGDEFVVLLEELGHETQEAVNQSETVAMKILDALVGPFQLGGNQRNCTTSIGVTLFREKAADIEDLLKQADLAMYQAKQSGRSTLRFFDPDMQRLALERAVLEIDLRKARFDDEFELYYQPQRGRDGSLIGAEALLRWNHPTRGLLNPNEFIPLAEEIGVIVPLGAWVMERACAQAAAWQQAGNRPLQSMAVNVSARQFLQANFADMVQGVLQRTGLDPNLLKLELTETLLVKDIEGTAIKMAALKRLGVRFALDDFGTGYSSLSLLRKLPLDQLKIDQSFIQRIEHDDGDDKLVHSIIALGKTLKMNVLAEGVEKPAQERILSRHGCDEFQGFLYGRPEPASQFRH